MGRDGVWAGRADSSLWTDRPADWANCPAGWANFHAAWANCPAGWANFHAAWANSVPQDAVRWPEWGRGPPPPKAREWGAGIPLTQAGTWHRCCTRGVWA